MTLGTKPKFKYKRVKIIWQDIVTDPSWYDSLEDVEKLTYSWCEDTGYLFSKNAKMVKIFTSYSYDGNKLTIGTVTVFPRAVVKKIEVLKFWSIIKNRPVIPFRSELLKSTPLELH
jgi:hypothetical protein